MSYNRWLYVYGNPINLTDPTGFDPNCMLEPRGRCALQRLGEIFKENEANGAKALVQLFNDSELQNIWGRYAGTTSATRLEWVLQTTRGDTNVLKSVLSRVLNIHLQFGVRFSSSCSIDPTNQNCGCGIASELEDSGFYIKYWGGNPLITNQINHFLSGVGEYYYGKDLRTIIAHEKSRDPGWNVADTYHNYYNEVTAGDYSHFYRAWHFDTNGMYHERDEELWPILAFGKDIKFGDADPSRIGNSLQDLRLSLKAVRFADWVSSHRTSNSSKAGEWLTVNLFP